MLNKIPFLCFFLVNLFFPQHFFAQLLPYINNYPSAVYGGETQNWKIAQTDDKKMYFANNSGLLEYNGAVWKNYPLPNGAIVRAVNAQGNTIYTGGFSEFGYWQRTIFNELEYTSLSQHIDYKLIEDEEIWKIIFYDKWILFQSLHKIFIYDSLQKNFNIIHSQTNLPKLFKVNEQIYFQKINKGLFELSDGKEKNVSDYAIFRNHIIINMFSIPDGFLVVTQDKGIFIWNKNDIRLWQVKASSLIDSLNIYSCERLSDGSLLLGTIDKGLYRLSEKGDLMEHIHQEKGLQNNTVLSIFEDKEHHVWLGLDNGISIIDFFSPLRQFNDYTGQLGAIYSSIVHEGYLYLGTNQGLFYTPYPTDNPYSFKLVEHTKGQVWQLKIIDGTLFCGHNSGTFIIEKQQAHLVCNLLGTWDIKPIENNPHLLVQGNYEGLHLLEKKDGKWQYRNKIEGFNVSSRFFEFIRPYEMMVSHEYKGVFRLQIDSTYTQVQHISIDKSAPVGPKSSIRKYNDALFYFCKKGLFKYNDKLGHFELDSSLTTQIFDQDDYLSGTLLNENNDKLWLFTKHNILKITRGKLDTIPHLEKMPISASFRKNMVGYENINNWNNGHYILGTSTGFLNFSFDRMKPPSYEICIDNIYNNKVEEAAFPVQLSTDLQEFNYTKNNLSFHFSIPFFGGIYQTMYQYKLEGLHEHWSDWNNASMVQFENLPAGQYKFLVRAKLGDVLSTNVASFDFVIKKPWYATKLMLMLYGLAIVCIFFIINKIYRLRYKNHKQKLIKEKEKELALFQLENDKTVMKLRNDKLQSEIESKNRELTATTMNIVRKNELLLAIKEELLHEKTSPNIKSVLTIIEQNINDTNDWEYFQEVFNHTDRDFLNSLKEKHANLTSNDIKLCIYLRLNLSSKEIASLLNISPQSVEIKRYRLRKKMNLEHHQNLTDYILSL